jgi:SNF2 family DNA or RNA helicase
LQLPWQGFLIGTKGYGKSVEAAAALNIADRYGTAYPAYIVCTNSMKYTWQDEIEKWCGVKVAVMGRTPTERKAAIAQVADGSASVLVASWQQARLHSRLAPYGAFARTEAEKQDKELNAIPFKTVIADEAHALKNPKSKQTLAVKAVAHAPSCINRWALTATPVAGNTGDLWSVLNFCRPDDFPSRSKFIDRYVLIHENHWGGREDLGLNPATEAEFRRIFDRATSAVRWTGREDATDPVPLRGDGRQAAVGLQADREGQHRQRGRQVPCRRRPARPEHPPSAVGAGDPRAGRRGVRR